MSGISLTRAELERAKDYEERIEERHTNDVGTHKELANIYQRQGRLAEAESVLKRLLNLEPEDLQAGLSWAGFISARRGGMKAEDILLEALRIDPQQPTRAHRVEQDLSTPEEVE
jgi:tetratricopeptide (TPR) repeat protein